MLRSKSRPSWVRKATHFQRPRLGEDGPRHPPRPVRLSARNGCFRPIFDSHRSESRAALVCTTLGAALRRRPDAAPWARALRRLRDYLLTDPSMSHLSLPRTTQWERPISKSIRADYQVGRLPGPQKHHRPIPCELEDVKVLPSTPSLGPSVPAGTGGRHPPAPGALGAELNAGGVWSYRLSGSAKTYRALPLRGWWMSGAIA